MSLQDDGDDDDISLHLSQTQISVQNADTVDLSEVDNQAASAASVIMNIELFRFFFLSEFISI